VIWTAAAGIRCQPWSADVATISRGEVGTPADLAPIRPRREAYPQLLQLASDPSG
jgi:hypothetical protein